MKEILTKNQGGFMAILAFALALVLPTPAMAHCDTLDGPVVKDARLALEKGDVTPVLKWIKKELEPQIRDSFNKTMVARSQGKEAKDLVEMYFFETVVRLHREGEGAPYAGLKPAGQLDPGILLADEALESGSANKLITELTERLSGGIKGHFARAQSKQKEANKTIEQGRQFVEAYVEFIHYVERIHQDIEGAVSHHSEGNTEKENRHKH